MAAKLWWMIHKDLISECRARLVWPAMLLLGVVVAVVFSVQMDLLPEEKPRMIGGLLWLAIFFAGMMAIDRSFAAEREQGCWEALRLYPVPPTAVYLAKLAVNVIALAALQCVLIPLFVALSDVPLLAYPWAMLLVAFLGNLGIASVGTLLSALTGGIRQNGNLLVLLVLPMVIPVVLAAAEATRLIALGDFGPAWWRWTELLGAFAVVFITAGTILFDFAIEE
ncbi:MAG TPA: heme exporter protein CcmB [Thermoguttaceae bacterium]|nr:heme exporter protein CcmB [Thermoguttaceae bacterium]